MHRETHLADQIVTDLGLNVATCYQCGKCSAGCPLATDMDYTSNVVLRLLQYHTADTDNEVLRSNAIWLCLSCELCYSRCPNQIDIPKLMDFLKQESLRRGYTNTSTRNVIRFHRSFLDMVRNTGRSYEVGLVLDYKVRSNKWFQDLALAPRLFAKGKLPLLPEWVNHRRSIVTLFKRTQSNK